MYTLPLKRRAFATGGRKRGVAKRRRRAVQRTRGRRAGTRMELKFHDLDIDDAGIDQNGTIAQVSCITIAQGTTESTRIGRKITIRQINWRFEIKYLGNASVTNTSEVIRVILYQDKQTNGATATVTGILETDDFQSFNQLANKSRFTILMDRTYAIHQTGGSGRGTTDTLSYGESNTVDTLFKSVSIPIEYDNAFTTGVIATVRSNNIGVLLLAEGGALCSFESKMRLRFSDT